MPKGLEGSRSSKWERRCTVAECSWPAGGRSHPCRAARREMMRTLLKEGAGDG